MDISRPNDLTELLEHYKPLHERYYDFPIPSMHSVIDARVLKNGIGTAAVGIIKNFVELILVMDMDSMRIQRVKSIDSLIKELIMIAREGNIEQIHAFPKEDFASYLIKHYGFERVVGSPIVLNLEV